MKDKKQFVDCNKFHIYHKKIIDEYLLIQLEDSGIVKIQYNKDFVKVTVYTSQSVEPITSFCVNHEDMKT